jgi:hypothetical protein
MNRYIKIISTGLITLFLSLSSCDYLDIVPDGIATIDNAFTTRYSAEKYLFTCFAYMPIHGSVTSNPAFTAGEEFFAATNAINSNGSLGALGRDIQYGNQRADSPTADAWRGYSNLNSVGASLYQGISDCNIFLENIHLVPDMGEEERQRWIGEVNFLKAYYHFWLVRQYGPIYIKDKNISVSVSIEESKVYRNTLDECFDYIIDLLDVVIANEYIPEEITNEVEELGRITKGIAMSVKAYVMVTRASPLFNGNTDYIDVVDNRGVAIFNPVKTEEEKLARWVEAAEACREAIDFVEALGHTLYEFEESLNISDETRVKLSIRGSVTENWNREIIWANPNSWIGGSSSIAGYNWPRGLVSTSTNGNYSARMNVPLKFVQKFYSKNGVPIEEDLTYNMPGIYDLRVATPQERYYIKEGYTTAGLNFDREPRFYASLVFDGNIWFGSSFLNEDEPLYAQMKLGQTAGSMHVNMHNLTGYSAKKLNHFRTAVVSGTSASATYYAWPVIRLADLYLLYAEALNEAGGSKEDVLEYVDRVRERAGLNSVEWSWNLYSRNPGKPNNQAGRRDIIQRERIIELAFEGKGYWDIRRWKTAYAEMNRPITGWYVYGSTEETYYVPVTLLQPVFSMKDYFWPIATIEMRRNENLVQNYGY